MTIALDYDGTYTADPDLWSAFIRAAQARGHKVIIATGRTSVEHTLDMPRNIEVVFCGRKLKEAACQAAGFKVDIWIDDMPGMIQDCRILRGDDL